MIRGSRIGERYIPPEDDGYVQQREPSRRRPFQVHDGRRRIGLHVRHTIRRIHAAYGERRGFGHGTYNLRPFRDARNKRVDGFWALSRRACAQRPDVDTDDAAAHLG